jgi:alkanesulfonate monooxygenase SsuD/methylene tetrahydromethanopterin reductase-like flavin-dependent oxidoreductase (luciferase family)
MRRLDRNRLSLGLFGFNCSGGLGVTTVPERWDASWENCQRLARMADDAGLDFLLPLGRWKGYGGKVNHNGATFETLTWASGLLASTSNILVFGTVHVPAMNPIVASKQMVTADHIGRGRFGLNIVCGWNPDEFDMLGLPLKEHERRYDQGQEWVDIITKAWTAAAPFDYAGEFYRIRNTVMEPKPWGGTRPIIVCAGNSERGRDFAAKNADMQFTMIYDAGEGRAEIEKLKQAAAQYGRTAGVFTSVSVTVRPTRQEAEEYFRHFAIDNADKEAIEYMVVGRGLDQPGVPEERRRMFRVRAGAANGGFPICGSPDDVANAMKQLSDIGVTALAMGFTNYLQHLPYFRDEVLPRLERLGVRAPRRSAA